MLMPRSFRPKGSVPDPDPVCSDCDAMVSFFIGPSLDGFSARRNGRLDFLPPDDGEPHGYDEFMASVDSIVIGRNTFETVLGFGGWAYGKKPVVVLSTKELKAPEGANCDFMSGDPRDVVTTLEQRGINH